MKISKDLMDHVLDLDQERDNLAVRIKYHLKTTGKAAYILAIRKEAKRLLSSIIEEIICEDMADEMKKEMS